MFAGSFRRRVRTWLSIAWSEAVIHAWLRRDLCPLLSFQLFRCERLIASALVDISEEVSLGLRPVWTSIFSRSWLALASPEGWTRWQSLVHS